VINWGGTPSKFWGQLNKLVQDVDLWLPRMQVRAKSARIVQLEPRSEQEDILDALSVCDRTGQDLLVLKPRQIGSSTIILAWLFWRWYSSPDPIVIIILSHKMRASKNLLKIFKRFYSTLPKALQRELETDNTTHLQLADSGAMIMAETAGGEGGTRSFDANYVMISEFAFAPNPEELMATAVASADQGMLIAESTANHYGDILHGEVRKVQQGQGAWRFLFFPWTDHEEYSSPPPRGVDWEVSDRDLLAEGLTPGQVYWRRIKVRKLGVARFMREYPRSVDEAYAQTSGSYFKEEDLRYLTVLDTETSGLIILAEYDETHVYGAGVDVGAGVGRDWTSCEILDKHTNQLVAIWRSNTHGTAQAAPHIVALCTQYGKAKLLVESNNYGHALITSIKALGYTNLWHDSQGKDWTTNSHTRPLLFEELKQAIQDGAISQIDGFTASDIRAIQVDEKRRIVLPTSGTSHGDNAVALGLAIQCLKTVVIRLNVNLPQWVHKRRAQRTLERGSYQKQSRY